MINIVKDYSLAEALNIIINADSNDIELIPHAIQKSNQRNVNLEYIEKCIIEKDLLGLIKTRSNRFKIIYPHETKKSRDLYIVIEIDENIGKLIVITIYTTSINRRLREHEI
ncbi:MAG: hypothetical protein LBM96_00760 [Methanobrevibacter sp.]|nr:hypothetical protein [Candidatus Methanoflexus mossambicus]